MAIKQLEERIGTRLLNRTTRAVSPTADGVAFYERCIRTIADFEEVEGLFRYSAEQLRGTLRVNVPGRIGRLVLAPALPQFLAQHPEIVIELGVSDRLIALQLEGVDCVVRVGELTDSSLIARRIGEIAIVNCASPTYLGTHGTPRRPTDLARHRSIAYKSQILGRGEPWEYVDSKRTRTIAIPSSVVVDSAEMLIALGLAGLGIIQVPAYDVQEYIDRSELIEIMPLHRPLPMPLHILYPHRRQLSRRLQVFVEWLSATLKHCVAIRPPKTR